LFLFSDDKKIGHAAQQQQQHLISEAAFIYK
jgi:hypothetical protein